VLAGTAGEERGASYRPGLQEATDERLAYLTQVERLRRYVEQAEQADLVAHKVAAVARQIWTQLSVATGNQLPVPDACPGPDGDFLYSWDRGDHHFEVEIEPGAAPTAFYWNRKTGETWDADLEGTLPVPEKVLATLRLLLR
jgi:hypothetical protein